ncbi:hypothetical protein HK101_009584 [Irineochytrium annulatum]|nr:hypothetical protein HK101_009584 [Irineochytrium annulatum]
MNNHEPPPDRTLPLPGSGPAAAGAHFELLLGGPLLLDATVASSVGASWQWLPPGPVVGARAGEKRKKDDVDDEDGGRDDDGARFAKFYRYNAEDFEAFREGGNDAGGAMLIRCTLTPACTALKPFKTPHQYEMHYRDVHENHCQECRRCLASRRLLGLHLQELHDSFFSAIAQSQNAYECFVDGCLKKFAGPFQRKLHLTDKHGFPRHFDFTGAVLGTHPSDRKQPNHSARADLRKADRDWKKADSPNKTGAIANGAGVLASLRPRQAKIAGGAGTAGPLAGVGGAVAGPAGGDAIQADVFVVAGGEGLPGVGDGHVEKEKRLRDLNGGKKAEGDMDPAGVQNGSGAGEGASDGGGTSSIRKGKAVDGPAKRGDTMVADSAGVTAEGAEGRSQARGNRRARRRGLKPGGSDNSGTQPQLSAAGGNDQRTSDGDVDMGDVGGEGGGKAYKNRSRRGRRMRTRGLGGSQMETPLTFSAEDGNDVGTPGDDVDMDPSDVGTVVGVDVRNGGSVKEASTRRQRRKKKWEVKNMREEDAVVSGGIVAGISVALSSTSAPIHTVKHTTASSGNIWSSSSPPSQPDPTDIGGTSGQPTGSTTPTATATADDVTGGLAALEIGPRAPVVLRPRGSGMSMFGGAKKSRDLGSGHAGQQPGAHGGNQLQAAGYIGTGHVGSQHTGGIGAGHMGNQALHAGGMAGGKSEEFSKLPARRVRDGERKNKGFLSYDEARSLHFSRIPLRAREGQEKHAETMRRLHEEKKGKEGKEAVGTVKTQVDDAMHDDEMEG